MTNKPKVFSPGWWIIPFAIAGVWVWWKALSWAWEFFAFYEMWEAFK